MTSTGQAFVKHATDLCLHCRPQEDRGNEAISTGSANTQGSHPSQGAHQPNPSSAPAQPQQQRPHTVGCVQPLMERWEKA